MYTLFIDTHKNTNLALLKGDLLLKHIENESVRQSTIIIPLIKEMLNEYSVSIKDINEIILVNGPGSFTGVRLGVTIAKTIAYTMNIPIKCLNALELKALMDGYQNKFYGIKDAKGIYLGTLKNDVLDLSYLNDSEINQKNIITDVTYDFSKLIKYIKNITPIEPHIVNPIYVKKIEAQK